tara:strand:+ start:1283 stop:1534 length:252 start_codon:yes stop_codon:yes gene_type:complete
MEHSLKFNTKDEAENAQQLIAIAMGLPKYATDTKGNNTTVIIDRYATPEEIEGKWLIPVIEAAQLLIENGVLDGVDYTEEPPQ